MHAGKQTGNGMRAWASHVVLLCPSAVPRCTVCLWQLSEIPCSTVRCTTLETTCCSVRSLRALTSLRVRHPAAYQRRHVASAAPHTFKNCVKTHNLRHFWASDAIQTGSQYRHCQAACTRLPKACNWQCQLATTGDSHATQSTFLGRRSMVSAQAACIQHAQVTVHCCCM